MKLLAITLTLALGFGCSKPEPEKPKREKIGDGGVINDGGTKAENISKDARQDYEKAVAFYRAQKKWTQSSCEAAAKQFESVADDHKGLVEARYMAGLSYHHCGLLSDAESAYRKALSKSPRHTRSKSNLGKIAFAKNDFAGAEKIWKEALELDPKLSGAHNNLAMLLIAKMRNTSDKKAWEALEKEAKSHLTQSLAVDSENVETYVLYGHLWMEGSERRKARLDIARLLLDEGATKNKDFPALQNAYGLLYLRRDRLGLALQRFKAAVELANKEGSDYFEARVNVGQITLRFRNYAEAEQQFSEALKLNDKSYEALIGLGYAKRGLGKFDEAEATYKKATEIDKARGMAYFNLGVLYKDFIANKESDLKKSQEHYRTAQQYFRTYLTKGNVSKEGQEEAKASIDDCDKVIKQLENIIKAQAAASAMSDSKPDEAKPVAVPAKADAPAAKKEDAKAADIQPDSAN